MGSVGRGRKTVSCSEEEKWQSVEEEEEGAEEEEGC